jgi:hypothetical protein
LKPPLPGDTHYNTCVHTCTCSLHACHNVPLLLTHACKRWGWCYGGWATSSKPHLHVLRGRRPSKSGSNARAVTNMHQPSQACQVVAQLRECKNSQPSQHTACAGPDSSLAVLHTTAVTAWVSTLFSQCATNHSGTGASQVAQGILSSCKPLAGHCVTSRILTRNSRI